MRVAREFERKTILITGGAGDIGRAMALQFATCGAKLILIDSDEEGLVQVYKELDAGGAEVVSGCVDVTDLESMTSFVRENQRSLKGIDVLINAAGIYLHKSIQEMSEEEWDQTLSVNLKGVFVTCKVVGPLMVNQESGGAIVNLTSIAAQRGSPLHAHYCASKAGIIGFGRALALELAPKVRVNSVAPGIIKSKMILDMLAIRGEEWKHEIPLVRFGVPEDVADAVCFLASDRAAYINGAVLNVNGGMWMD